MSGIERTASIKQAKDLSDAIERNMEAMENPQERERAKVRNEAVLQKIVLASNIPGGANIIRKEYDVLRQSYASITQSNIAKGKEGLADDIRTLADTYFPNERSVHSTLLNIAKDLDIEIESLTDKRSKGTFFLKSRDGAFHIRMEKLSGAIATIKGMKTNLPRDKGDATLDRIALKLEKLRNADPIEKHIDDANRATKEGRGETDTRPIRLIAGIAGALAVGIGIGETLLSKEHKLSPATLGWALVTALLLRPDLMKSPALKRADNVSRIANSNAQAWLQEHMGNGDDAVKALNEYYDLPDKKKYALQNLPRPNMAAIGNILDAPSTMTVLPKDTYPLLAFLQTLPADNDRQKFFHIFSQKNREVQEIVKKYIKARGDPKILRGIL